MENKPAILTPAERLELEEPDSLVEAIENGFAEADFKCFGTHMTATVVKRHIDEYLKKLDLRIEKEKE